MIPTRGLPDHFNAASAFVDRHLAEGHGKRAAFRYRGQPLTYAETVVVTASKVEQQLINAPAAVSVVTSDVIESSPAQNYGDLLRAVPGVNVAQTSARDINIVTRGATSTLSTSQLALLDGRTIYQDFFGFVAWDFLPVDTGEIAQIEVIRGPASAVWGANALSGVVNVITKTPGEGFEGKLGVRELPDGRNVFSLLDPGNVWEGGRLALLERQGTGRARLRLDRQDADRAARGGERKLEPVAAGERVRAAAGRALVPPDPDRGAALVLGERRPRRMDGLHGEVLSFGQEDHGTPAEERGDVHRDHA